MNTLNIGTFNKLAELFEEKEWEKKSNEQSLFNRLSRTLGLLNEDEQLFFLEILSLFEYYSFSDYEIMMLDLLKKIICDNGKKTYYFIPIISDRKNNEIKSSMLIAYLFKSNVVQYDNELYKIKKVIKYDLTESEIASVNRKNSCVILVDDFIGTGDSALKAANYFVKRGLNKEKILISSLVTLSEGIEKINNKEFSFYYSMISKNLTEVLSNQNKDKMFFLDKIKNISEKLGIDGNFYGYNDSEALISMIRIPNNTVNFFWKGKNKDNIPFPRL